MKDDKELSEEAKIAVAISHETLAKVLRKYELADHAIEFAEWIKQDYTTAEYDWAHRRNSSEYTTSDLYKIFIKEKEGK